MSRQALLGRELELFLVEFANAFEAFQERNVGAFATVRHPRAEDLGNTLKQLRDTKTRLARLIAQEHESS